MQIEKSQLNSEFPPKCDVMFLFLNEITEAVRECGYSRAGVIDRMNEALGGEVVVTSDRFNKWLAPSSDRHFPMMYVPALCWAVKNTRVIDILLRPLQHKTIDLRGQTLKEAAELQIKAKEFNKQAENLMASVSE